MEGPPIIVSACLLGVRCRYDGEHRMNERISSISGRIIPLCPEELGGLPTPRPPAEIVGGDGDDVLNGRARVLDVKGNDLTENFLKGAREFLGTMKLNGARKAIMKDKSPSCGVHRIYHDGVIATGKGVSTALLLREGIEIISDEEV